MTETSSSAPRLVASGSLTTFRLAASVVYSSGRLQLLAVIGAAVLTAIAVAGNLLVGRTVLDLIASGEATTAGELAPYLALLGGLLMLSALGQAVGNEMRIPLGEKVKRRTMGDVLDIATEVELETYEGPDFHDRLRRAQVAATGRSTEVVFGVTSMISALAVMSGVVAVLFGVAPILVPVAIAGYVPIAYVNMRNNRAMHGLESDLTELHRKRVYLERLLTSRDEAAELRSYNVAATLRNWYEELWDISLARLGRVVRRRLALTLTGSTVAVLAMVATLSLALILAVRGTITIGEAAIAIVGLQQLNGRLQTAGGAFTGVHEGVLFLRDFERFRAELPAIRARRPTGVPPFSPRALTVEGLGYRYPGASTDALRRIDFEIRRGQILAVVGANGSGKSTLAKLLCGLLMPQRGSVRWDGVDLGDCDPRLVREHVAPVFQHFAKYMLTMRHAIAFGDVERLDDEAGIRRAADLAGVADLADRFEHGFDTFLGKEFTDGVDISGGQWQRLAIARALFRDAPVVVLDEPSASLDPRAEADLFDVLQTMCLDRIVVFVSHRFSTVRNADVVLVLDQGEVVETGSHDDLMEAGGLYADLFTLQAHRYGLRT